MAKIKGRAKQFQDPDEVITKDYDPEANGPVSDAGSDASEDENLGTEHYVSVGKSKLRRKENVSLGPEYRGSRVSRSALEESDEEGEGGDEDDDEYDDPDEADLAADEAQAADSEIDSEDALGESDAERFQEFSFRGSSRPAKAKRATAADYMSEEEEDDDDDSEQDDMDDGLDALVNGDSDDDEEEEEEEDEDEEDEMDEDEDEDEEDDDEEDEDEEVEEEDEKPKRNAKPNMGAPSKSADVEKGVAIQKQRKVYDGLLNLRIRLQKALIAANTFPLVENDEDTGSEPYEAAEEAAVKLLNTISSLRDNFGPSTQTGSKRKRDMDASMTTSDIWAQLQAEDDAARSFREARLEKWSKKVQSVNMARTTGLSQRHKTLVGSLQDHLLNPDGRLVKRTRVPRSCAPAQAAKKVMDDEHVYDDADFYQMLLKELVDQRTVETNGAHASAVPTVMVAASKEPKIRKQVDRKASKGRKMRFTVHEKLQNFMAPEDRRSWEQSAIDRFFGTLFGQKMELNEDESDEDMESVDGEEGGLRLF